MPSFNIRIDENSRETLRELARNEGATMQLVLQRAIENYRRQRFFDETNAAYASLKSDPAAWREELEERTLWEQTLGDGQDDDESSKAVPR